MNINPITQGAQFSGLFRTELSSAQRQYLNTEIHLGPSILRDRDNSKKTIQVHTSPADLMKKVIEQGKSGYLVQVYQVSEFHHWHKTAEIFQALADDGFVNFYDPPMPSKGMVAVGYGNYVIQITRKGRHALKALSK